jgi:hypothetical protein
MGTIAKGRYLQQCDLLWLQQILYKFQASFEPLRAARVLCLFIQSIVVFVLDKAKDGGRDLT